QVVEEGGDIAVAFVELIPEIGDARVIEPARGERGLAAAWRAGDPRHRDVAIEQAEQALARERAGDARASRLAERDFACLHFIRPSPPPPFADRRRRASRRALSRCRAGRSLKGFYLPGALTPSTGPRTAHTACPVRSGWGRCASRSWGGRTPPGDPFSSPGSRRAPWRRS